MNHKINIKDIENKTIKELKSKSKEELNEYIDIIDKSLIKIKIDIKTIDRRSWLREVGELRKLEIKKLKKKIKKILKNRNKTDNFKHPFKDRKTYDLFIYLVDEWKYRPDIKFAYIYNFLESKPYKTDYEIFVKKRFNFVGLFNYNNANSKKNYNDLKELKKLFMENYR